MGLFKLITLTGPDRIGKWSQCKLLQHLLKPCATMTFPEYGKHWAAELVRASLDQEEIQIIRGGKIKTCFQMTKGCPATFQMLQSADRVDRQAWIIETLETQHIVADRYEVDALAYGLIDGCSPDWLMMMDRLYRPSDLAIALIGTPFEREEAPDLNERDTQFQMKVMDAFESWSKLIPERLCLLRVDSMQRRSFSFSLHAVHCGVVNQINVRLGMGLKPLSLSQVEELLPLLTDPKARHREAYGEPTAQDLPLVP